MNTRTLIAAVIACAVAGDMAAQVRKTTRHEHKYAVAAGGSFVLDNPLGNIEIVGADVPEVQASVLTTIVAPDNASLQEATRHAQPVVGGDTKTRVVRNITQPGPQRKPWTTTMHWTIRVPRGVSVRINSVSSGRIRIANIAANLRVNNFNGNVVAENILGATHVESVNGSIIYATPQPRGNVVLSTVNGHVTASVAGNADFRWIAETATGDIRTNLPARGAFFGATFRGSVNAPGGPTITTQSMMGDIHLLASGSSSTSSTSLRKLPATLVAASARGAAPPMTSANGPREMRRGTVKGLFTYSTNLGNVRVTEIQGSTEIFTGAGEVHIGSVTGAANVRSNGGPLQLGEILGPLNAMTRAGDILVDSTRRGGTIETQGGTIRLLYTSGPTRLVSGGGDITVRQAAAPIAAETASGDIQITIDPTSTTERITARTNKGNVVLNVNPRFKADIDATITTADPNADTFLSDIPGLTINREVVAGKTRVRATGKLNGGGEKVTLFATDGDIRITSGGVAPTIVKPR